MSAPLAGKPHAGPSGVLQANRACKLPCARMRIAYVTETYPPEINGVALTVSRVVAYLRQRGHTVDLIRPRRGDEACGAGADELRVAGCALPMYRELRFGWPSMAALAARLQA